MTKETPRVGKGYNRSHPRHQTLYLPQPRPGPPWTDATQRKAPHKPLLLLALLDLVPQPGTTITSAIINNTSSVTYLRRHALGARLDDGLFRVMQSGDGECAGSSKMLS